LISARRLVVKLGTAVVTLADGEINRHLLATLAQQMSELARQGKEVVVITSGAVRVGLARLGLDPAQASLPVRQAAASVGQTELVAAYQEAFSASGQRIGQILVTQADLSDSRRYLHLRNALFALLHHHGVIPVMNENDPVSPKGAEIGENDRLAAAIAARIDADLLVLLSDVEGLFTADPHLDPAAQLIEEVAELTPELLRRARDSISDASRGGMKAKLEAARAAMSSGLNMVIARGDRENVLLRITRGERVGTLFVSGPSKLTGRKRWIGFALQAKGGVVVDDGAKRALVQRGSSLLPAGVSEVLGEFRQGDAVSVFDQDRNEIARGLANYSSQEVRLLRGSRTSEIESKLGRRQFDEVIHRDNLVILAHPG
jgi:glutamate 5-kinase